MKDIKRYKAINLTNFRRIIQKENQLIFEQFDGTNIIKLGSFLIGLYCSIEAFHFYYSSNIDRTNEEILNWLESRQERGSSFLV